MWNTVLKTLNTLGLNGSTLIIVALGLYGYFKLAYNHFKHLNDRFTGLEKGQIDLGESNKKIKTKLNSIDRRTVRLEALYEKDKN